MNSVLHPPHPTPLRDIIVRWLLMLVAYLDHAPKQKPHWGSTPYLKHRPALLLQDDIATALGHPAKAIIFQKVTEWCSYNEYSSNLSNFHEGHWWTRISYTKWAEMIHWQHIDTTRKQIRDMEELGILISAQFRAENGDCDKWYRVDSAAMNQLLVGGKVPTHMGKASIQLGHITQGSGSNTQITKENPNKNLKIKDAKSKKQQQQILQTGVVVSSTLTEPKSESGEYCIDGEAEQQPPRQATRGSAIVQAMHREDSSNTTPIPNSAPPLTPSVADMLRADLIRFGVMPHKAQRLVDQHSKADIRAVLAYAHGAKNLQNPPGFVIDELDTRKMGVLVVPKPLAQPAQRLSVYGPVEDFDPLPPAVDDPAWNEMVDMCAMSIPELNRAVCRAAGDRYEIAVEGPMTYLPLNHRKGEIQRHLEQLTGHPVSLFIVVDTRLQADFVS